MSQSIVFFIQRIRWSIPALNIIHLHVGDWVDQRFSNQHLVKWAEWIHQSKIQCWNSIWSTKLKQKKHFYAYQIGPIYSPSTFPLLKTVNFLPVTLIWKFLKVLKIWKLKTALTSYNTDYCATKPVFISFCNNFFDKSSCDKNKPIKKSVTFF